MVYLQELTSDSSQVKKPKNSSKYYNSENTILNKINDQTALNSYSLAYNRKGSYISTAISSISAITPPLEGDYCYATEVSESEISSQINQHFIGDLPNSPDSITNLTNKLGSNTPKLLVATNLKSSNIASHTQLHSNHRFHPFHLNSGTSVGGSNNSHYLNNNISTDPTSNSIESMPETDCYFPSATTNMLDYHSSYMGELSPSKCDYQVNGYASNYYSSMQNYPLNNHSNSGQHNSTLSAASIPNAASFYNSFYNNGMLSQGYQMAGAYNFTNSSLTNSSNVNQQNATTNHLLQSNAQASTSLDENVQQLYHNSSTLDDYASVSYSGQLNAQQTIQQTYTGTGNIETDTAATQQQHANHSHTGSHSSGEHVHSNSAHALLASTCSNAGGQSIHQRTHNDQIPSNYYYSHLQNHPTNNSSTTPSAHIRRRQVNQPQTAAALLHQHQNVNYQQNPIVTEHSQHLQNHSTAVTSCPSTSLDNSNAALINLSSSGQLLNSNNSSNSINSVALSNGPTANNDKLNTNEKIKSKKCDKSQHTKSLPNSPVTQVTNLNTNRSSPNTSQPQHPTTASVTTSSKSSSHQATINLAVNSTSNNNVEQLINKNYPNPASVLIEGLTELDLVNGANSQQQSISPLIVVNCNNSLSSNNSNCTDDTVTYQHPNNNSITLTDLNAQSHYQTQLATMIESPSNKCPSNSGEMHTGFKKMKTSRGRAKKQSTPDPETTFNRIFIWDLDETLIILNSLLNGIYANENQKEPQTAERLGKKMENIIFNVARKHFLSNNFDDYCQYHIDEIPPEENESNHVLNPDEYNENHNLLNGPLNVPLNRTGNIESMTNLQLHNQQVKKIYHTYRNNFEALIDQCGIQNGKEQWAQLKEEINQYTDGWISYALECLKLVVQRPGSINILVADVQLSVAISKVMAFGLGPLFPIENIYSSSKIGRRECFKRIQDHYGKKQNLTYIVVGDGEEEEVEGSSLGMIFWRINNLSAMSNLFSALKDFL